MTPDTAGIDRSIQMWGVASETPGTALRYIAGLEPDFKFELPVGRKTRVRSSTTQSLARLPQNVTLNFWVGRMSGGSTPAGGLRRMGGR